jgi:ABC-type transport system involved in multi-copper enzyme maturation permease subunit
MSAEVAVPSQARAARIIVGHALKETVRRRVLVVVAALTVAFLVLYAIGTAFAFEEAGDFGGGLTNGLDDRALTGATLLGLAMFATLFLGAVLATFLTMGVVRGDAETGMLQPLIARPPSRATILIARTVGASLVAAAYVVAIFVVSVAITAAIGDWTPDRLVSAALLLALAVVVVTVISVTASIWLTSTAQGVTVLMVYGGGITAGLLGQIGDALDSDSLERVSEVTSWALPFEAVYQSALYELTADTSGITGFALSLGPFGGAESGGAGLLAWSLVYSAVALTVAIWGFRRRDL